MSQTQVKHASLPEVCTYTMVNEAKYKWVNSKGLASQVLSAPEDRVLELLVQCRSITTAQFNGFNGSWGLQRKGSVREAKKQQALGEECFDLTSGLFSPPFQAYRYRNDAMAFKMFHAGLAISLQRLDHNLIR